MRTLLLARRAAMIVGIARGKILVRLNRPSRNYGAKLRPRTHTYESTKLRHKSCFLSVRSPFFLKGRIYEGTRCKTLGRFIAVLFTTPHEANLKVSRRVNYVWRKECVCERVITVGNSSRYHRGNDPLSLTHLASSSLSSLSLSRYIV